MKLSWWIWGAIIGLILGWLAIPYFLCSGFPPGTVITTTTNGKVTC